MIGKMSKWDMLLQLPYIWDVNSVTYKVFESLASLVKKSPNCMRGWGGEIGYKTWVKELFVLTGDEKA